MRQFILLFFLFNTLWDHSSAKPISSKETKNKIVSEYSKPRTKSKKIGLAIDRLNGVNVYFNGPIRNVVGRNITKDGYNLGLKYQCIEFVKRYYYKVYNHKMPDSYGHAKDFFDLSLNPSNNYNKARNLLQYWNGGKRKPKVGDIFVFKGSGINPFGHIGIVSMVSANSVEMVQQNVGEHTRNLYELVNTNGSFKVIEKDLLGWLSKS